MKPRIVTLDGIFVLDDSGFYRPLDEEPETKSWSWMLYIPLAFVVFAIGAAWLRWGA